MITNITSRLYQRVLETPDRLAYAFEDGDPVTFERFWKEVSDLRSNLRARGLNPGDRVVVLTPISREIVPLIAALFAENIVPVLLDPRLPKRSWMHAIRLSGARHLISVPPLLFARFVYWPLLRLKHHPLSTLIRRRRAAAHAPIATPPNAPVLISLTSGTTGAPKLVIRNFEVLLAQQTLASTHFPEGRDGAYVTSFVVAALQALIDGVFVVLVRDARVAKTKAAIDRFQPTRIAGSPAFLKEIANAPRSAVDVVMTGGAPLPRWFLSDLHAKFPRAKIYNIYGSTECEPIALTHARPEGPGYFVGSFIPELDVRKEPIGKKAGHDLFEIHLKGENIVHGALDSGDVAREDEHGVWLLGRRSEMIEGLPVGLIEEPLEGRHGIQRIAVVERKGLHVFAELKAPVTPSEELALKEKVAAHLADLGLKLTSFQILPSLPVDRRHRWKIQRARLQELCE